MNYNKRKTRRRKTRRRRRRGKRGGDNFQSAATVDSRQTLVEKTKQGVEELKEKSKGGHQNILDLIDWTAQTASDAAEEFDREAQGAPEPIMSKAAAGVGMPTSGGKRRRRKTKSCRKKCCNKKKSRKRRSRKKSRRKRKRSSKRRRRRR
jgi:hypothetical protein